MGAACGHTFCRACAVEYTGACAGPARCPACHKALTIDLAVAAPVRGTGALGSVLPTLHAGYCPACELSPTMWSA